MAFNGPIPQAWVEALASHLSKNTNGGRVLAEQLCRDNHEAMTQLFEGTVSDELAHQVPVSVITGKRLTKGDVR